MSIEIQRNTLINQMQSVVASLIGVPLEAVNPDTPLDDLGVDSATSVSLSYELECLLGRRVDPSVFFEHRTIRKAISKIMADC